MELELFGAKCRFPSGGRQYPTGTYVQHVSYPQSNPWTDLRAVLQPSKKET